MIELLEEMYGTKPWFLAAVMMGDNPIVYIRYLPDDTLIYNIKGVRVKYRIGNPEVRHVYR